MVLGADSGCIEFWLQEARILKLPQWLSRLFASRCCGGCTEQVMISYAYLLYENMVIIGLVSEIRISGDREAVFGLSSCHSHC